MTAPHVSIVGSAFSGNKGAAAMLESSIHSILAAHPDATFTLFSTYPAEDRRLNPYPQLEVVDARPRPLGTTINILALLYRALPPLRGVLRKHSNAMGALARSDVLLDQMGISFTDGREKFLLFNTAAILPAFQLKVPVVKCAQAIGPFTNPINRRVSRWFLPRVHTIVTRGHITHGFARDLGLDNLIDGADSAFALVLDGSEGESVGAEWELSPLDSGELVVGVSPSVVVQKKVDAAGGDYLGLMSAVIDELVEQGRQVMLLPHSARTGVDKENNNDLPLCRKLYGRLTRPDGVLFIDAELTSQQLRWLIGRCEVFVTSRFHAMVSALAVATPVLVIGWSHKYAEVLEMFGLERWAIPYVDATAAGIHARLEELTVQRAEIADTIAARLPGVVARTKPQEDAIETVIRGSAARR